MVRDSSATFKYMLYSKHIEDWEEVKRLWPEPKRSLRQQLKERGRVFIEVLRARQELTKAHFQVLCLRRKIRKGELVAEDIEQLEMICYGRYAAALDTLERYTGRSPNLYGLLRILD
jgi:hypothetical protein